MNALISEPIRTEKPFWNELKARYLTPRNLPVSGIVLHDTCGTGTHNDTLYLADPKDGSKVSADFAVERNGSIWKLNPDLSRYYCNHAGRSTSWRTFHNSQVNETTIGIEIVQKKYLSAGVAYPEVQVQSVAGLCAWLISFFNLTPDDITTHRQIIMDGSRTDPRQFPLIGENGFWSFFWKAYR